MKKHPFFRKLLSLILCVVFSISFFSTSALATDLPAPKEETSTKTTYDTEKGTTTITITKETENTTETPIGTLTTTETTVSEQTTNENDELINKTDSTEIKDVLNVDEYDHIITDTTTTTTTHEEKDNGTTVDSTETTFSSVIVDSDGNTLQDVGYTEGSETTVSEKSEHVEDLSVTFDNVTPGTQTDTSTPEQPLTTGDLKEDDSDESYDQTTTSESARELTVTLTNTEVTEGDAAGIDLEKGLSAIEPTFTGTEQDMHIHKNIQFDPSGTAPDGYDYYYSGYTGDSSYGAKRTEDDGSIDYADILQFELTEKNSGETLAVYCVDLSTGTQDGWWYSVENLEDADYYSVEDAKHIRAIVTNGYWGVADPQLPPGTAADDTPPPSGSLANMKAVLKQAILDDPTAADGLTADDIDKMTEGEAMAITQMAIWKYGNQIEGEFTLIPSNYDGHNEDSYTGDNDPSAATTAAWNRISKISALMATMSKDTDNATEVLSPDKFISDLTVTVKDKVEDHANNLDSSDNNDAYNAELSFVLEVVITEKDELVIKVLDANGNEIRSAKLGATGSAAAADTILPDENGSYVLTGLTLIEGDVSFSMKLEGAQYLEEGVYIYSSESRKVGSKETPAQTFVGIANGYQAVDLSMNVELKLEVDEGQLTTEREWRNSWGEYVTVEYIDDTGDDDTGDEDPSDEDTGDEDTGEVDPQFITEQDDGSDHTIRTGDDSNIMVWGIAFIVSALIALGIALYLLRRKKYNTTQ